MMRDRFRETGGQEKLFSVCGQPYILFRAGPDQELPVDPDRPFPYINQISTCN